MTYTQYNYNKNNTPQYQRPPCKYCGDPIKWKRDDQTGKWIAYNQDEKSTKHDRDYCDKRKEAKAVAASSGQVDRSSTSTTSSTTSTMGAIDPHLNSILIKISNLEKAVMELKQLAFNSEKRDQTSATIQDTMAQKIELLVAKQGYPEPQKIMAKVDPIKYTCKNCNKVYPDYDSPTSKEYCSDCLLTKNKEEKEELGLLKNIATELAKKEEPTEVINPYRVNIHDEQEEEKATQEEDVNAEKSAQIFKEQVLPAMEKTMPSEETDSPWNEITSGMNFICHSCQKKSDKGYEKWSTRICDKCHNEIEETKHAMAYSEARDLEQREERFSEEF